MSAHLFRAVLAVLVMLGSVAHGADRLTLGVFAFRPQPVMIERFQPLADYLSEKLGDTPVDLEVLEQEELEEAVAALVAKDANEIIVVPVFFGQGGHLRNDFPVLLESCQKQFPGAKLSATPAVGEDSAVLQAIVDFGARAL